VRDVRSVTGSQAGLSGDQQIRIALQRIVEMGGTARTSDLYGAVEDVIEPKGYRLSSQGKSSLRFFVNRVAVEAGLVHPYDSRSGGWRVTTTGRDYIKAASPEVPASTGMLTPAGTSFQFALTDVYALLEADAVSAARASSRQASDSDVFLRAAVILTVTAWETSVEDTLRRCFERRLNAANCVGDMQDTFDFVTKAWIKEVGGKLKPEHLATWTGEGWKAKLLRRFESEVGRLNTPDGKNTVNLFRTYLDVHVHRMWTWKGMTGKNALEFLDRIIQKRRDLVHRGKSPLQKEPPVDRDGVIEMVSHIEQLVWCTEASLGVPAED